MWQLSERYSTAGFLIALDDKRATSNLTAICFLFKRAITPSWTPVLYSKAWEDFILLDFASLTQVRKILLRLTLWECFHWVWLAWEHPSWLMWKISFVNSFKNFGKSFRLGIRCLGYSSELPFSFCMLLTQVSWLLTVGPGFLIWGMGTQNPAHTFGYCEGS